MLTSLHTPCPDRLAAPWSPRASPPGIYLHGFVTTFCARDGLVRMTVLFYLTLLALPVLAVLDR